MRLASFTHLTVFLRLPHIVARVSMSTFYGWIILHILYIEQFLSVHHLMNIRTVCTFWLLWIVVLWTQYKFSNGCILLGVCYGKELLSHMGTLFNLLRNCQAVFHIPISSLTILVAPSPYQHLSFCLLRRAIL